MGIAAGIELKAAGRPERRSANVALTMREFGQTRSIATLLDVSAAGCKLETNMTLRAGTQIWVNLPGLKPQAARVVWSRGGQAGCRFAVPLHPAVFEQLLKAP